MAGVLENIRKIDAFPKVVDEFRRKTWSGGVVTICSIFLIGFLIFNELCSFIKGDTDEYIGVDTDQNKPIAVRFDIEFHKLPCVLLTVSYEDSLGHSKTDIKNNIYKIRLASDGKVIGKSASSEVSKPLKSSELAEKNETLTTEIDRTKCGSCYGAARKETCCRTCDDIRDAYIKRGWAFEPSPRFEQCAGVYFKKEFESERYEGCRVRGYIEVAKVVGQIDFAPDKALEYHFPNKTELLEFTSYEWNATHTIHKLYFGPKIPNYDGPLQHSFKSRNEPGLYHYYTKVVPTVYIPKSGPTIHSNQYAVNSLFHPLNKHSSDLPGVSVHYDISPIVMKITESGYSVSHFITSVFAIIGGMVSIMNFVDIFVYNFIQAFQKQAII